MKSFKSFLIENRINGNDIFSDTTGMPYFDDIMTHDKSYYEFEKGVVGEVVWMSPTEYLKKSAKGKKMSYDALMKFLNQEKIKEYKEMTLNGSKMPIPVLEYQGKVFDQEGNHRSYVAMLLGVDKIPVLVVTDAKRKAWEVSRDVTGMSPDKHEWIVRDAISKGLDVPANVKALYGLN